MQRRQAKRTARMEEMKNRRAERETKRAQHQDRSVDAEEKLRASNPELYELRQQQREEIRQQVMEDLAQ